MLRAIAKQTISSISKSTPRASRPPRDICLDACLDACLDIGLDREVGVAGNNLPVSLLYSLVRGRLASCIGVSVSVGVCAGVRMCVCGVCGYTWVVHGAICDIVQAGAR